MKSHKTFSKTASPTKIRQQLLQTIFSNLWFCIFLFYSLMEQVPRSQRYIYLKNKSLHNNRLKNMRPAVDDRVSPALFKRSIDESGYFLNNKKRNSFRKTMESENQKMAARILKIMSSPRRQVQVQGYSKYNLVKRDFLAIKKKEQQRKRSIDMANCSMSERLCKAKPNIGCIKDWSEHYNKFVRDSRIIRKYKDDFPKSMLDGSVGDARKNMNLEEQVDKEIIQGDKGFKSQRLKNYLPQLGNIKSKRHSSGGINVQCKYEVQNQQQTNKCKQVKKQKVKYRVQNCFSSIS